MPRKVTLNGFKARLATSAAGPALIGALVLSTAAVFPALALAQNEPAAGPAAGSEQPAAAADSTDTLSEVVVTARRSSENLQTTPLAITAMSGAQLESRGFTNVADLSKVAPNVSLQPGTQSSGGKSLVAYIRGVGQADFNFAYEPAVGVYLNDVYFGTLFGSDFDFLDIDHVEVLRGPQGTLFGRNNEGGAIRIFTQKPTDGGGGYVEVGYGSYNRREARAAANVTLLKDKVFLRLSAGTNQSEGYFTNYDFACKNPSLAGSLPATTTNKNCVIGHEGGADVQSGRADLRILASPQLEINLSADISHDNGEPSPNKALIISPTPALVAYNNSTVIPAYGIPVDSRFVTSSPYSGYGTFRDDLYTHKQFPTTAPLDSYGFSGTIDLDTPVGVHIRSITGYRHYSGEFALNQGSLPIAITDNYFSLDHSQVTEELQLSGHLFDNKLDWTAGGFYYSSNDQNGGEVAIQYEGLDFSNDDTITSLNESAFIHGVYHITSKLSLEAGARFSHDAKTYTFRHILLQPFIIFPAGTPLFPVSSPTTKSNRVDPKVSLEYQWTPEFMTYAQLSTGYKAGGVNPRPLTAAQALPFAPENLTAYEVGVKSQWFDNRLRFNGAAFYSDYKNLQLQGLGVDSTGLPAYITLNVGHAVIEGLEGEIQAEPVAGLLLNADVGFLHYETKSLGSAEGVSGGPTDSSVPPYTPKFKGALGAQYAVDLGHAGVVTPRIDYVYQSRVYFDAPNTPGVSQGGYSLVNAKVTWRPDASPWSASLSISNLTNKVYYIGMTNQLTGGPGILDADPAPPRMVFVSLKRTF